MPDRAPIYLDHHATTPVDPRVLERMLPALRDHYGNPASTGHAFGWAAAKLVEDARTEAARLVGGEAAGVVFTSGATEAINLALKGVADRLGRPGRLITTNLEHAAVREAAATLARRGWEVVAIVCGADGLIALDDVEAALAGGADLVSIIQAHNEIGTLQPVREIAAICREHGAPLHVDAAQAAGKVPVDVAADGIDLLSFSAHKMYGPKGVGALYVRPRLRPSLQVQLDGGGQERGLRSGTLNVPGIVGMGEACRLAREDLAAETERIRGLRDRLLAAITAGLDGVRVNGSLSSRLAGNLSLGFSGIGARSPAASVAGVALSAGSACSSGAGGVSRTLLNLGLDRTAAAASLRIGVGRFNTAEQIDRAAEQIIAAVRRMREE